jgi:hypothetical protein
MAGDKSAFSAWWGKIKSEYNVRANVGIDGSSYAKYGTTFDNQILVIDKNGATTGEVITGKVDHPKDALKLLKEVHDERPKTTQSNSDVAGGAGSNANVKDGGRDQDTGRDGASVDTAMGGGRQRGADRKGGANSGRTDGNDSSKSGAADSSQSGKPGNRDATKSDGGDNQGGNRVGDAVTGERRGSEITLGQGEGTEVGEITSAIFEPYSPKKVRIDGAVQHNTPLVESSSMAAQNQA